MSASGLALWAAGVGIAVLVAIWVFTRDDVIRLTVILGTVIVACGVIVRVLRHQHRDVVRMLERHSDDVVEMPNIMRRRAVPDTSDDRDRPS